MRIYLCQFVFVPVRLRNTDKNTNRISGTSFFSNLVNHLTSYLTICPTTYPTNHPSNYLSDHQFLRRSIESKASYGHYIPITYQGLLRPSLVKACGRCFSKPISIYFTHVPHWRVITFRGLWPAYFEHVSRWRDSIFLARDVLNFETCGQRISSTFLAGEEAHPAIETYCQGYARHLAPIPLHYRAKKPPGCCRLLCNHPYLDMVRTYMHHISRPMANAFQAHFSLETHISR